MADYIVSSEVLQQAVLVIEFLSDARLSEQGRSSIETLRKILAAPPAEPVAWVDKDDCVLHEDERETPVATLERMGWIPLYKKDA